MVYLIGASGLAGLFRKLSYAETRLHGPKIYAVGGLSFNSKANNMLKTFQNLLRQGPLRSRRDIVIWHGVISNTVSVHSTNNFQACSVEDLLPILVELKARIASILYLQLTSEKINIVRKLFRSKILILDVRRHLISRLKGKIVLSSLIWDKYILVYVAKNVFSKQSFAIKITLKVFSCSEQEPNLFQRRDRLRQ